MAWDIVGAIIEEIYVHNNLSFALTVWIVWIEQMLFRFFVLINKLYDLLKID